MILLSDAISSEELDALLRQADAGWGVCDPNPDAARRPFVGGSGPQEERDRPARQAARDWHHWAMRRGVVQEWHAAAPPITLWLDLARRAVNGRGSEPEAVAGRSGMDEVKSAEADGARRGGRVFWVGRVCWPHVPALLDATGATLLDRSIFIHTPTGDEPARVWAMDLLLRRARAAAVIGDGRGLSMAGSRRLQLAAEASGALMLLWRTESERGALSAAPRRWHVTPRPTERPHPGWQVTLFRCKEATWMGQGGPSEPFALEFRDAQGVVDLSAELADRPASPPMDPPAQRTA